MTPGRLVLAVLSAFTLAAIAPAVAAGVPEAAPPPVAETADTADLFPEGPLFTPAPQQMAPECHFCASTLSTPAHSGRGATCFDAENDLRAQLAAFVDTQCLQVGDYGRCAYSVVLTCACYYQNGEWVIDGYANYRCWMNYCEVE